MTKRLGRGLSGTVVIALLAGLIVVGPMGGVPAGASAPWQWVHQLGSYYTDVGLGVAADTAGNVYVTGFTYATLPGAPETNDADGEPGVPFIAKYDTSGTKLWVHQFGPGTVGFGVAVDGSGNAYVATDAGVVKFDTSGTELWFQSIATSGATYTRGVAVDGSGSAYVTGSTRGTLPGSPETNAGFADVFVAKYDTSGTKLWVHQLGSASDEEEGFGVAVDGSGNAYLTGKTRGTLPGSAETNAGGYQIDVFVAKYDTSGTKLWVHQLGTTTEEAGYGVAVDGSGNAYLTGYSRGTLPGSPEPSAGNDDVFVAKYDTSGTKLWVHQLGASGIGPHEVGRGVAVDSSGNSYVAGYTEGTLPGSPETNAGTVDVFVAEYDTSGTKLWVHQLGSNKDDAAHGVAVDGSGNAYLTGNTVGTLPGSSEPQADTVPEPYNGGDVFVVKVRVFVPVAPAVGAAAAGNGSVSVAFTPSDDGGAAPLHFDAACTSSDGGVSGSGSGASSPVVVSGLTNGKTYTCTVTATNSAGTSAPSVPSNSVLVGAPGAPIGVSVVPASGSASVSWTAPPANAAPIDHYDVSCVSSNGGSPGSASVPASPVTITGLTTGKTYTCTVTATNSVGTGAGSVSSSFIVGTAPAAPTIGTATRGNASASVTFTPGSDGGIPVTSFTMSCTSVNGGASGSASGSSSPIVVSGLTNGYTYTCRVTATNANGTSAPSAASNLVQPATVPLAPTIGTVSLSGATAIVPFSPPSKNGGTTITSYMATCTSSNGGTTRVGTNGASPVSVSSLTPGKTYTCSVRATNAVGTGPPSAASNAVTVQNLPGAPTAVKAVSGSTTAATGSLTVSFAAPASNGGSAITSYTATCGSSNGGATGVQTGAGSPLTVAGVTTGSTYTCTVQATNAVGTGVASAPSLAVIVGSPAPPTNVKAVSGSATTTTGSLTVTFVIGANNGSAITSQTATCVSSNGGVTKTGTHSGATAAPITVAGVTTGVPYTCTVKATNARGAGLASAPSLAVIVGSPAAPTAVRAVSQATTTATGSLTVTFNIGANNGSAITSQTATCVSSNGGVTKTGTHSGATAAPITVAGVTTGKSYTCTVTATNARGPSLAGGPSLAVIVGSPAPPTGVTAVKVASGQIRVSFTPGANNGSAITSFTATCTSSNGGVAGSKSGGASPLTVINLTATKTYTCTVKATNARGAGLSSAPSGAVVA